MGDFKVELYEDKAPLTTGNFINLSQSGYYDNTTFHRVMDGFMIQGGDPRGDGTGGPGYTIPDEFDSSLNFVSSGILAMANTGQPNTGGSQFFVTLAPTSWLNQKHTIFGRVVEGMDVVKAIGKVQTDQNDKPVTPVVVKTIRIVDE